MKRLIVLAKAVGACVAAGACTLQSPPSAVVISNGTGSPARATFAQADALAPLLDRTVFLAEPDIFGAQLSPDGELLAFLQPLDGVQTIWTKRTDEPFSAAQPVTAVGNQAPETLYWSHDSRTLLFTRDAGGHGKSDLFAARMDGAAARGGTAQIRNLTNGAGTPARVLALPEAAPHLVYVGLSDGQRAAQDVYAIDITTGNRSLLLRDDLGAVGWVFDLTGKPRLAIGVGQYGEFELMRLDAAGATLIYQCAWRETCIPLRFDPDGRRVYLASNRGDDVDKVRLVALDVQSGRDELIASDPAQQVDLDDTIFSPRTHLPVATIYEGDAGGRYAWNDERMQADFERLQSLLPGMDLRLQTPGDRAWLVFARSDREPGEAYLFDPGTGALTLQYRLFPSLPRDALATMASIRYPSADGFEIQAYLTLPRGEASNHLPLLVMPHSGPWNVRDEWGYSGFAQFFANRGFAVLQPNFRGSIGFGTRFLEAGDRQWGERMQDDITRGVQRLVASGIVDPDRVAIAGMSYGGYAALAGAAFTPELYAAAISMAGPSDLSLLMESDVVSGSRVLFAQSVGDPSTPEGLAQLQRQSPLNAAEAITAPIMIVQGALDPASVQEQTDRLAAALRQRNAPVVYLLARDEAHVLGPGRAWADPLNNLAVFAAAEKFLGQTIGTRYQEDMSPEAAQRLRDLTVLISGVPFAHSAAARPPVSGLGREWRTQEDSNL